MYELPRTHETSASNNVKVYLARGVKTMLIDLSDLESNRTFNMRFKSEAWIWDDTRWVSAIALNWLMIAIFAFEGLSRINIYDRYERKRLIPLRWCLNICFILKDYLYLFVYDHIFKYQLFLSVAIILPIAFCFVFVKLRYIWGLNNVAVTSKDVLLAYLRWPNSDYVLR